MDSVLPVSDFSSLAIDYGSICLICAASHCKVIEYANLLSFHLMNSGEEGQQFTVGMACLTYFRAHKGKHFVNNMMSAIALSSIDVDLSLRNREGGEGHQFIGKKWDLPKAKS